MILGDRLVMWFPVRQCSVTERGTMVFLYYGIILASVVFGMAFAGVCCMLAKWLSWCADRGQA